MTLVATLGLMTWHHVQVTKLAEERSATLASHELGNVAEQLHAAFRELIDDTRLFASMPPIEGIMRASQSASDIDASDRSSGQQWRARLASIGESMLTTRPYYQQLRFLGVADHGREIVRVDAGADEHGRRRTRRITGDELQQKADEFYFREAVDTPAGEVYISPATVNREFGVAQVGTLVVRALMPVHSSDGRLFGFVAINADLVDMLNAKLARTRLAAGFLAHVQVTGGPVLAHGVEGWQLASAADIEREDARVEEEARVASRYILDRGTVTIGGDSNPRRLDVTVYARTEDVNGAERALYAESALIGFLFVLAATMLMAAISGRLLRPLAAISATIRDRRVLDGDLPVERVDEFGQLARSLREYAVEREEARSETQRAEARLNAIFASAPDGMITIDQLGTIVEFNQVAGRLFGREPDTCIGADISILMPTDQAERHHAHVQRSISAERLDSYATREVVGLRADGSTFPIELSVGRVDFEGEVLFSAVLKDITARREQEEQLQSSNRELLAARDDAKAASEAKSSFLANMSHEIRTPLNAIIGLTSIVLRSDLSAQQHDYLQTVVNSSEALMQVINDILDFSKIEAGKLELQVCDVHLHTLVPDVLRSLAIRTARSSVEITCRVAPTVPSIVRSDPTRLRQILNNLVGNAIKFTQRGEIRVELNARHEDGASQTEVELRVIDTGIGIPADLLESIFDPFEQVDNSARRPFSGTGLGLAITRRIVDRIGGTILVRSRPGAGSTFTVTMPLEFREGARRSKWQERLQSLAGKRVLIVDDNATSRLILREMLERTGMAVAEASGTAEGLACVSAAIEAGAPYDLLVSDVHMPDGGGVELCRCLRTKQPPVDIPTVLVGSQMDATEAEDGRALGIRRILLKPVLAEEIYETLVNLLAPTDDAGDVGAHARADQATATEPCKGLRILLAEDSLPNQKLALALLAPGEHDIVVVPDGRRAVEEFTAGAFDIVLMDVQMPEVDGFQATQQIRSIEAERGGHTPIVAMTAHALKGDEELCLSKGMDGYVSKPIDPRRLEQVIVTLAGRAAPSAADVGSAPSVPGDAAASLPAVPWPELRAMLGDDAQALRDVSMAYLDELRSAEAPLAAAIDARDAPSLVSHAHRLKSAFGFFRLQPAAAVAQQVETAARNGDVENGLARSLLATLRGARATLEEQVPALSGADA